MDGVLELLAEAAEVAEKQKHDGQLREAKAEKMADELQCQRELTARLQSELSTQHSEANMLRAELEEANMRLANADEIHTSNGKFWAQQTNAAETDANSWKATAHQLRKELHDAQEAAQAWKHKEVQARQRLALKEKSNGVASASMWPPSDAAREAREFINAWGPSAFVDAPASEHPWPPAAAAAALRQASEPSHLWPPFLSLSWR